MIIIRRQSFFYNIVSIWAGTGSLLIKQYGALFCLPIGKQPSRTFASDSAEPSELSFAIHYQQISFSLLFLFLHCRPFSLFSFLFLYERQLICLFFPFQFRSLFAVLSTGIVISDNLIYIWSSKPGRIVDCVKTVICLSLSLLSCEPFWEKVNKIVARFTLGLSLSLST